MILCRPRASSDYPQFAELRWLLKTDDGRAALPEARDSFIRRYCEHLARMDALGETRHWLAAREREIIGVMTVRAVEKEPSPGRAAARWGYLTNCYLRAEARNQGLGSRLLDAVKSWAKAEKFELLIVWPSEPARSFYARAGFAGASDPLELSFE